MTDDIRWVVGLGFSVLLAAGGGLLKFLVSRVAQGLDRRMTAFETDLQRIDREVSEIEPLLANMATRDDLLKLQTAQNALIKQLVAEFTAIHAQKINDTERSFDKRLTRHEESVAREIGNITSRIDKILETR